MNIRCNCSQLQGRIQDFFLGGGALVSCSTSTPINHIVFVFWQNTSCIRKPQVIPGGGGTHPLHPSPRSAPELTWQDVYRGQVYTIFQILPATPSLCTCVLCVQVALPLQCCWNIEGHNKILTRNNRKKKTKKKKDQNIMSWPSCFNICASSFK